MKPALFKIASKKKCYLVYGNLLILDIPFSKMSACVTELHNGKTDRKSLWTRQVFNLSEGFSLEYDEDGDQTITMSQDNMVFVEESPERSEIAEWLIKQLRQQRFNRFAVSLRNPKILISGFITTALTAILTTATILAINNEAVLRLLTGRNELTTFTTTHIGTNAIALAGILLIVAIMARAINGFINGGTRIIYKKETFDMGTYRQAKTAANANVNNLPVRVSAVSGNGRYSFARSYKID